jgi:hypothetical protein
MFFDVERLVLAAEATALQGTGGRFHILNLVEGDAVTVRSHASGAEHRLAYAETLVIPAAVGQYEVTAGQAARLVRAVVR